MKRDCFKTKVGIQKNQRVKRKPLRTFLELAEEFGVSRGQLQMIIAKSGVPFPIKFTRSSDSSATWYEADAVRQWWKENKPQ